MPGLPLPGLERYLESILGIGAYLKIYSENPGGFCFIVAADAMLKGGRTSPGEPNCGAIHLHAAGRAAWIRPMCVKPKELGIPRG